MDREDYMRCSMELNDHFEGRSQISGAACLFASTAIKELLDRAEKAERERDAAIKELDSVVSAVDDLAEWVDNEVHPVVDYTLYTSLRENVDAISMFEHEEEWRGKKEE